jgi:hypothetical protein
MFMKLFLLDHYNKHNTLPVINKELINSCMKILCNEKSAGRPPKKEIKELKDKLTSFYKTDFQPLIKNENLDYTHMNTILDYLTIDILTMYENNIKLHYVEYIERYVRASLAFCIAPILYVGFEPHKEKEITFFIILI